MLRSRIFFFPCNTAKKLKKNPPSYTKTMRKLKATQSSIKTLVPAACQKQQVLLTQALRGILLERNKLNSPLLTHGGKVARTGEAYRHLTESENIISAAFLPKGWIESTKKAHSSLAGTGTWSLNMAWKSRKNQSGGEEETETFHLLTKTAIQGLTSLQCTTPCVWYTS